MKYLLIAVVLLFSNAKSCETQKTTAQTDVKTEVKAETTETTAASQADNQKEEMIQTYLNGHWTEGQINDADEVVPANLRRGGWYHLVFEGDNKITFKNPMNCGFGAARIGTYEINESAKTLTFHFTDQLGYDNADDEQDKKIDIREVYNILRVETKAIVFQATDEEAKTWVFVKTEE